MYIPEIFYIYKISAYIFFKRILICKEIYIRNGLKKYINRYLGKYIWVTLYLLCIFYWFYVLQFL